MNPYTKKYLEFLENNDDPDLKFSDIHEMTTHIYEVWALEEITKKNVMWNVRDKLNKGEYSNTKNGRVAQLVHNERKRRTEDNKPFWFITLCPKPDADFEEFKSAVEDISTFIWVEKCYWAFEQRGTTIDEVGKGFHAHIILEKYNIAPSKLKTIMKNKFSKFIVVDKYIDNKINCLQKEKEWLQDKLDYIMGHKIDDDKPLKCEMDVKFRELKKLKKFYKFDVFTDERKTSKSLGGRREGSGVKKGTKRGKYDCKKNNLLTEDCNNNIKIIHKKKILEF